MKLKNLSVFLLIIITIAAALESESLRSKSCKRCLKENKGSRSKCAKKCKASYKKATKLSNSKQSKKSRVKRIMKRIRKQLSRKHFKKSTNRKYKRGKYTRGRITRRRRYYKRQYKKRFSRAKKSNKILKANPKKKTKLMTFKLFQSKKTYFLTKYYWPHWHNYYTIYKYYPYYNFYWFFYGHYHTHFPHYYSYFFHKHPHIHHFHVTNTVYLTHGHPIVLASSNIVEIAKYNIVKCQKGPKQLLTVHLNDKNYRIFLGDVNDLTNLSCLYFMDAVVSVGKSDLISRVSKLYSSTKKVIKAKGKKITIRPFAKNPYLPSKTNVKQINKNLSSLSFTMTRKKLKQKHRKSLLFYHLFNLQYKQPTDSKKIFDALHKKTSGTISNVLFIADHLEPNSIFILKHLLSTYLKLTHHAIAKITYRRLKLFSGIVVHSHHHSHHHH